mmetsp:Transcript_6292/g.23706  ORF Transcript_6292/g.23706 Transcript_6292/m.23706 type:complete len:779 (-) Transcript_6292:289-2625(-)
MSLESTPHSAITDDPFNHDSNDEYTFIPLGPNEQEDTTHGSFFSKNLPPRISLRHSHQQRPFSIHRSPVEALSKVASHYSCCSLNSTTVLIHGGRKEGNDAEVPHLHTLDIFSGELKKVNSRNSPSLSEHIMVYETGNDWCAVLSLKSMQCFFLLNARLGNSTSRHWVGASLVADTQSHDVTGATMESDAPDPSDWVRNVGLFVPHRYRPSWLTFTCRDGQTHIILICLSFFTKKNKNAKDCSDYLTIVDNHIHTHMVTLSANHHPPGRVISAMFSKGMSQLFVLIESAHTKNVELWQMSDSPWMPVVTRRRAAICRSGLWNRVDVMGGVPPSLIGPSMLMDSKDGRGFYLIGGKLTHEVGQAKKKSVNSRLRMLLNKQSEVPEGAIYRFDMSQRLWSVLVSDYCSSDAPSLTKFFVGHASHNLHFLIGGTNTMDGTQNHYIYRLQNLNMPPKEVLPNGLRISSYFEQIRHRMVRNEEDGSNQLMDCIILTKDGPVRAHKCVLCARSPALAKQLAYTEDGAEIGGFHQFSKKSVQVFLDYLYTCQFDLEQVEYDDFFGILLALNMHTGVAPLFQASHTSLYTHSRLVKQYVADFKSLVEDDKGVSDLLLEIHPTEYLYNVHELYMISVPHFERALSLDMKERQEGIIRMEEVTPEAFHVMLEYIYTGFANVTGDNCVDVYFAAAYIYLSSLLHICSGIIIAFITFDNAFDVLMIALAVGDEALKKKCSQLIGQATMGIPTLTEHERYSDLPYDLQNELSAIRADVVIRQLKQARKKKG